MIGQHRIAEVAIHHQPPRTADQRCRGHAAQRESSHGCQAPRRPAGAARRATRPPRRRSTARQVSFSPPAMPNSTPASERVRPAGRAPVSPVSSNRPRKDAGSRQHVAHGRGERRQARRAGGTEQRRRQREPGAARQRGRERPAGSAGTPRPPRRPAAATARRCAAPGVAFSRSRIAPIAMSMNGAVEGLQLRRRDIGPEPAGDQRVRVIDVVVAQIPVRIRRRMRGA